MVPEEHYPHSLGEEAKTKLKAMLDEAFASDLHKNIELVKKSLESASSKLGSTHSMVGTIESTTKKIEHAIDDDDGIASQLEKIVSQLGKVLTTENANQRFEECRGQANQVRELLISQTNKTHKTISIEVTKQRLQFQNLFNSIGDTEQASLATLITSLLKVANANHTEMTKRYLKLKTTTYVTLVVCSISLILSAVAVFLR